MIFRINSWKKILGNLTARFSHTGLKMSRDAGLITLKKNYRVHVSKDMCIVKSWYVLRPFVVEHIAGSGYVAIPYFLDTKAYQIGHIFVQESSNVNLTKKRVIDQDELV